MKSTSLIFIIISAISCKEQEVKKVIEKFDNGKDGIVNYYKNVNDTLNYRKEVFYNDGTRYYTGHFINGKKAGVWTWLYPDGKKKDQCKYEDGYYIDTVYHWYPNGKYRQIEIVSNRKIRTDGCCTCDGTIIRYDNTGKILEKFTSQDDKLQGEKTDYYEDGSWIMRTYKNDNLHGPTIEYNLESINKRKAIGQYKEGKEDGLWKWFDENGKTTDSVFYKKGIIL